VDERTEALVRDVRTGSDEAKRELLVRYLPEVYAFVRLRLGPRVLQRESGADVVQSVCREVLQELDEFEYRGERQFRSWLMLMAQRKLADKGRYYARQRRGGGRPEQSLSQAELVAGYRGLLSPSDAAIREEEVERLERAFDRLPPDYREALMLSRFLHLETAEIAQRMGRTEGATRNLVSRAIARLALLMERDVE